MTCTRAVFDRGCGHKARRTNSNNDDAFLNVALANAHRFKQLRELSKGVTATADDSRNGITMKPNNGDDNTVVHVFDRIKQEEEALGSILLIGSSKRRRCWLLPPHQ